MGRSRPQFYLPLIALVFLGILLLGGPAIGAGSQHDGIYLPLLSRGPDTESPEPDVEFRGLWITRFNWTSDPTPARIEQMVNNAASAGFNALLFQVRGTADAYYDSRVEPWAAALGGSLGVNPGWDPLAHMIDLAHARGLQVHAYINVYPVWTNPARVGGNLPPHTQPEHLYHKLAAWYGSEQGKLRGLQWNQEYEIPYESYLRVTPASVEFDGHLLQVVTDLVSRYEIDGLHLDHIRYGKFNSCDPVTEFRYEGPCFQSAGFADWQRAQVNGTVGKVYDALFEPDEFGRTLARPGLMLSAAVWPFYESGYNDYFQDPKAWLAGGYIDAIMPMLYGTIDFPQYYDDPLAKWRELAAGFQADNAGRFVITGIHGGNFGNFAGIAARIEAARALGTAGHAIFAYNYLEEGGYFDDLAAGPYRDPAVPPAVSWHP